MDLDEVEDVGDTETFGTIFANISSSEEAVEALDASWYSETCRKSRWMDLIGDYAGNERFILDGEALLQNVLDNTLLAIGRPQDPSFQILHGRYLVEKTISDFIKRSAVFDIVFWHENRHVTLHTGTSKLKASARSLARRILFRHLLELDVSVYVFNGTSSLEYGQYLAAKRPMFVMTNDGGLLDRSETLRSERILLQRTFLFEILSSGLAIALLSTAEFKDSKIMAHVFEQRREADAHNRFPKQFWLTRNSARVKLQDFERMQTPTFPLSRDTAPSTMNGMITLDLYVVALCRRYLAEIERSHYQVMLAFLQAFTAHLFLLDTLSIEERVQPLPKLQPLMLESLLDVFLPRIFSILDILVAETGWALDIDSRLFVNLLHTLCLHPEASLSQVVGEQVSERVEGVWSSIDVRATNLSVLSAKYGKPDKHDIPAIPSRAMHVLPFDNSIVNEQLSAVGVQVENAPDVVLQRGHLEFGGGTVFADTRHWHNQSRTILPKHLGGEDVKVKDAKMLNRQLRRQQRFMANLQKQATTLTGALGAPLEQQLIVAVGHSKLHSKSKNSSTQAKIQQPKATKKVKEPKLSSADKIRQKHQAEKQSKADDESSTWWRAQLVELNQIKAVHDRARRVEDLFRNKWAEQDWLYIEIRLYRLHLEILTWIDDPSREDNSTKDRYTVTIMRMVKALYDRKRLSLSASSYLEKVLATLGFSSYVSHFSAAFTVDTAVDRPLSFDFVKLVRSKTGRHIYDFIQITEDPVLWQLRLFGDYMDRSMDSKPDSRVHFDPDGWQRDVLDCLDANKSILVVAPTSAGKTFISYYAMEQVLRASDEGILVYVAPTKALVNQIAAEIYARFRKDLNGRSCWAIHTRDYRIHDPQKCQILVTVPEMFAIMLLSPPLSRIWVPRIKRVILDEIHSIGQQEGGAVWEQILLLAPCPIIGLSATIGHPELFNSWLESVQKAHGFEHAFINHPHRYSHLRKHMYLVPSQPTPFIGLTAHSASDRLRFLHPISLLNFGTPGLPPDLSLEASDTLTLYRAMVEVQDDIPADLKPLDPLAFFADTGLLRQQDVLRYEAALKETLMKLVSSADSAKPDSAIQRIIQSLQDPILAKTPVNDLNIAPSPSRFLNGLPGFLADLESKGDLPALLFAFDRHYCEVMAKCILEHLEAAEEQWRDRSPEWKRKIQAWEAWKVQKIRQIRTAEKPKKQKRDEHDELPESVTQDASWEASFNPEDPSPDFSFAGTRKYSKSSLEEDLQTLRWTSLPKWIYDALRRGIGVHHSGMNKAYRSIVESLFRQGYLKVVFATGTLALGINAPTKTSVFCGDSPFLTSLMFRQCAGRAGRRGYDLLGKVVFYGLPMDRIQRLVLSKLSRLSGNFPLSSTLCLRLFNLLNGSDNAKPAVDAVQSILKLPQVSFGSETGRDQLLHHMRFSIDYLRRIGLLDVNGRPMNLFGIAAHLYHTEPSNFALVVLMREGVIHNVCGQTSLIKAKSDFMLIMANLFGRKHLPAAYTTKANLEKIRRRYPSKVILPPLPEVARDALLRHNDEILGVFSSYAYLYSSQRIQDLGPDNRLPLTELKTNATSHRSQTNSLFHDSLRRTAIPVVTRSLFVANSGYSDEFSTVDELVGTCRRGLNLNEHAIPSLGSITLLPSGGEDALYLNAYLLDFYIHGQVSALEKANGIRRGDVWYLLQDFHLTLMSIRSALEQLLVKASGEFKEEEAEEGADGADVDSGYFSADVGEEEENASAGPEFNRPARVSDSDWRVYEVVDGVLREFEEKYKKIWA